MLQKNIHLVIAVAFGALAAEANPSGEWGPGVSTGTEVVANSVYDTSENHPQSPVGQSDDSSSPADPSPDTKNNDENSSDEDKKEDQKKDSKEATPGTTNDDDPPPPPSSSANDSPDQSTNG